MSTKASLSRQYAKRGAVLILVLGVLVILALLATTFARLQTVERQVSINFTDDVRAKLFAQSGVEDALTRLGSMSNSPEWKSFGYDMNEDGIIQGGELDPGQLPGDTPGLETTKNPSFAVEVDNDPSAGLPDSKVVWVEMPTASGIQPRRVGLTGVVGQKINDTGGVIGSPGAYASYSGAYCRNGDFYSVRVADTAGCVYVNDGVYLTPLSQPAALGFNQSQSSVTATLANMLNNLGTACGCVGSIGTQIINARPSKGYVNKDEIRSVIGTANYDKISAKITTTAWVDKNVVNPVPFSLTNAPYYKATYYRGPQNQPQTFRHGGSGGYSRGVNYVNNTTNLAAQSLTWYGGSSPAPLADAGVYGVDELNPQYIEITWRAPVNVNSAPVEVLTSLITGVEGVFLMERRSNAPLGNAPPTFSYSGAGYGGSFITCTVSYPQGITASPPTYSGHSWLYEMHTYDKNKPSNASMVASLYGGGTVSIGNNPDMDELGYLYSTNRFLFNPGTSGAIDSARIAAHIDCCRKAKPNGGATTSYYGPGLATQLSWNYSDKHFGGPFKTWAQFNEFIDYLVEVGEIRDNRIGAGFFNDYDKQVNAWSFGSYPSATTAPFVPRLPAKAAGDALKANFNPNCHLNELNPDRNMFQLVDKTDLIVNTTELTFRPTGYFEIESLGRVLRPNKSSTFNDALLGTQALPNEIVAEKKIAVQVKTFDLYRETSQRHFYGPPNSNANTSAIAGRDGIQPETNNNMSLELGPEPDNGNTLVYGDTTFGGYGVAPNPSQDGYAGPAVAMMGWGYEYDGYIRLATLGGPTQGAPPPVNFLQTWNGSATVPFSGTKTSKPQLFFIDPANAPGAMGAVRTGGLGRNACMRAHFAFDDSLDYSEAATALSNPALRADLASNNANLQITASYAGTWPSQFSGNLYQTRKECYSNFPDYTVAGAEPKPSPYDPTDDITGKYRTCRSFRLPLVGASGSLPILPTYAPCDLRTDGLYSERHSAPAYWLDHGRSWDNYTGMASAWIKPNFFPEHSGKPRKFICMSKYHGKNLGYKNPQGMDMHFMPAHDYPFGQPSVPTLENASYGTSILYPYPYPGGAGNDAPEDALGGRGPKFFRPMSLTTDAWMDCFSGSLDDMNHEGPWLEFHFRQITETLNHNDHSHGGSALGNLADMANEKQNVPNQLEGHRWSHIGFQWFFTIMNTVYSNSHASRMWVNDCVQGKEPGNTTANTATFTSATGLWCDSCWSDNSRPERPYYFIINNPPETAGFRLATAVRLGEADQHFTGYTICNGDGTTSPRYPRNFSADCTFDEFYMYRGTNAGSPLISQSSWKSSVFPYPATDNTPDRYIAETFLQGRYYRPTPSTSAVSDSFYISPWLSLQALGGGRVPPPASTVTPPVLTGGGGGGGGGGTVSVAPASAQPKRVLGVSWTWHPEGWSKYVAVDPTNPQLFGRMVPYALNWATLQHGFMDPSTTNGPWYGRNPRAYVPPSSTMPTVGMPNASPEVLYQFDGSQGIPMCRLFVDYLANGAPTPTQYPNNSTGYLDDGYSEIKTSTGGPLTLNSGDKFRYKVLFQVNGAISGGVGSLQVTPLLVSPYFDDVTFYFDSNGQPEYLSWSLQTF